MFGKTMSIPDKLIYPYFELISDVSLDDLKKIRQKLEDRNTNPMTLKRELGRTLIRMYHSEQAAHKAEEHFDLVHKQKEIPDDIPTYLISKGGKRLIDIMVDAKMVNGTGEARRLIRQGGVKIDGETVKEELLEIQPDAEKILKVGKRKFLKLQIE
jgi:tyrosyl-tRNA synthetase